MSDGGKGDKQRPTDQKKFSANYDQIKWTIEEDEEFNRLQDSLSAKRTLAQTRDTDSDGLAQKSGNEHP